MSMNPIRLPGNITVTSINAADAVVQGVTDATNNAKYGVYGESDAGIGVLGGSQSGAGVAGYSATGPGAYGTSGSGTGVQGDSSSGDGVQGQSGSGAHAGVSGNNSDGGYGLYGNSAAGIGVYAKGGNLAAQFVGDVAADGDIQVTGDVVLANPSGGDCAEDFDVEEGGGNVMPGTLLVIGDDGRLCVSSREYDSRVAGVVSGAGSLHPAIVLNRVGSARRRLPVALMGTAYCKADATSAPISPGDLLTTSATPGYAMKAEDPARLAGAVVGKALGRLASGKGLIPILVSPR